MDEKEKKELIDKILSVEKDSKSARVSSTVFINKASKEEAAYFLNYLGHHNPALKKLARSIVSQVGVPEAFDMLQVEFNNLIETINYWPDPTTDETNFYPTIIELLETIFTLAKTTNIKSDKCCGKMEEIFRKSRSEDLRFSLIKLLGFMGDKFSYFMEIFNELSEKERKALYYVYAYVPDPKRMDLYKKGLLDERNFDYVVASMLNFPEGRALLHEEFLGFTNYNKQVVLKKLQDGKYPEFMDLLIKILGDKNRLLAEMATEILKSNVNTEESLKPFINILETGYSPESVTGALEVIAHCSKRSPANVYIQGLELQPTAKNKDIILEFFTEQIKTNKLRYNDELIDRIFPILMSYFDTYTKDKEELYFSTFQLVPLLRYNNSIQLKAMKKKILTFKKDFDSRLPGPFKNTMTEFIVKLNQLTSRFDETEIKLKNIMILFDFDPLKIDQPRMMKLKDQLAEIETMDEAFKTRLVDFLAKMLDTPRIDWKNKSLAVELLGEYGNPAVIPKLLELGEKESSLAVKVNAQKAAKKIEDRHAAIMPNILLMEPLPYIQKKLSDFFKSKVYRVFVLNEAERFPEISQAPFKFLVVSESLLVNDEFTRQIFDYLDENFETALIIVTVNPDLLDQFNDIPNVKFLKKPFNDEMLVEAITMT